MRYRILGSTGYTVSEVGYGSWSLGADWGDVSQTQALAVLHAAVDSGVNFIDTADVYGDGKSEKIIGIFLKQRKEHIYVTTKAGRRLNPHEADGYTKKNLILFVDRSRKNLGLNTLDLLQLHCPPTPVYYRPEVFEALDDLIKKKKIRHYGVSVEKVEEGIKALEYPGISTIQIVFNMFRQRPSEHLFALAKQKNVGIIVRVPLASGLLTGAISKNTQFPENDHRNYNREGQKFDVGETFSGIPLSSGFKAVEQLKAIQPKGYTMAQFALKWILMHKDVSTVIPGGKRPEQIFGNTKTSDMKNLSPRVIHAVKKIYESSVKPLVHQRW